MPHSPFCPLLTSIIEPETNMDDKDVALIIIICCLTIIQHVNQNMQMIATAATALT